MHFADSLIRRAEQASGGIGSFSQATDLDPNIVLARVEAYERRSLGPNPLTVAVRPGFHKGLRRAGMAAQESGMIR